MKGKKKVEAESRPKCNKKGGYCGDRDAYGMCLSEESCEWKERVFHVDVKVSLR